MTIVTIFVGVAMAALFVSGLSLFLLLVREILDQWRPHA